eukprot:Nk52_evm11s305 gene=Nk52_evmTU11s305
MKYSSALIALVVLASVVTLSFALPTSTPSLSSSSPNNLIDSDADSDRLARNPVSGLIDFNFGRWFRKHIFVFDAISKALNFEDTMTAYAAMVSLFPSPYLKVMVFLAFFGFILSSYIKYYRLAANYRG